MQVSYKFGVKLSVLKILMYFEIANVHHCIDKENL